jgi:hypothetical protein
LRRNTPPQNIVKETAPQQAASVRPTTIPEKKIEAPERKIEVQGRAPAITVNEQPTRANIIQQQTPRPSDNMRSIPPLRSNSAAIAVQVNPQKNEDKPIVRGTKPQEAREVWTPVRPNDVRENIPPRNTIKESLPQQAAPVRPAIVPERKVEAPERKVEVLKKNPDVSANEQGVRTEVRHQQNPKPIENVKIAPPVRSNSQATISQPPPPPQKTEDPRIVQKTEQAARIKPIENIAPAQNRHDPKGETR